MPRRRSSPVIGGRGKRQRLAKKDPSGASQRGVLTSAPAGTSPPANAGRQQRAKAKGLTLPTLSEGAQMFKDIFFPKKNN